MLTRDEEVTKKIDELIELTKDNPSEVNARIILTILQGARYGKSDDLLAIFTRQFMLDVLLPKAMDDRINTLSKLN